MCGRLILGDGSWSEYHAVLSVLRGTVGRVSYNIKPTETVSIVRSDAGMPVAGLARWWFVPHWFRDSPADWKATTFNARIETAAEKPVFRTAWRNGRCLIPASGYYEWTGIRGRKQPWFVAPDQNLPVFFFAGLSSLGDGGLESCAILTRPADPVLEDLHPRMPVMLTGDELLPWLDMAEPDEAVIERLGTRWDGRFVRRRVRPFGIADDGPELIEPVGLDL